MSGFFHEDGGQEPRRSMSRLVLFIITVTLCVGLSFTLLLILVALVLLAHKNVSVQSVLPVLDSAVKVLGTTIGVASGSYLVKMAASGLAKFRGDTNEPKDPGGPA